MNSPDENTKLAGITLAQAIETHGRTKCGDPTCFVDAAIDFVNGAKRTTDPWAEVLALHFHSSMQRVTLIQQDAEHASFRRAWSLFVFDLLKRLGGIVFVRPFTKIEADPGLIKIDCESDGGHCLKIVDVPSAPSRSVLRRRRGAR